MLAGLEKIALFEGMRRGDLEDLAAAGPHVMIVGAEAKGMTQANPRSAKGDPDKPYVMWPDTPYEHLMFQVK